MQTDQKTQETDGGDGQRRYINRSVLPNFPPHGPVKGARLRHDNGCDYLRFKRFRRGIGWSSHLAAPRGAVPCATPASFPITPPITATNTSAMLGVCTSPSLDNCSATCWRPR